MEYLKHLSRNGKNAIRLSVVFITVCRYIVSEDNYVKRCVINEKLIGLPSVKGE